MEVDNPLIGRHLIHKSRVIEFAGKRLWGNARGYNYGRDDSIVQAMFSEFVSWNTAIASSGNMINSHSLFKYKLKGLSQLVKSNDKSALYNRFNTMMMGLSSLRGYVLDADGEDIEFVNRNYSGVDKIIAELKESLASAANMPYTKIWGSPTGGAFSESGASDRYEWANIIDRYRSASIEPGLNRLTKLILLADNKSIPKQWHWHWNSPLQLTLKEQAEMQNILADADTKNVNMGVLHPMEVRYSRFGNAEFNAVITLEDKYEGELMAKPEVKSEIKEESPEITTEDIIDELEGYVLDTTELNDLSIITEEDKKNAINHWKEIANTAWRRILESEVE